MPVEKGGIATVDFDIDARAAMSKTFLVNGFAYFDFNGRDWRELSALTSGPAIETKLAFFLDELRRRFNQGDDHARQTLLNQLDYVIEHLDQEWPYSPEGDQPYWLAITHDRLVFARLELLQS